mmetsp:Transcript_7429/g.28135  ORF Transcript_7429/g.28135 Transcript_7429/m.28135 type:complete len:742 (-) Transcript_7429:1554-3779(-)
MSWRRAFGPGKASRFHRYLAAASSPVDVARMRNIGISAHIDSGKTTLTERILFYTGRISSIHDVRGKDGVGAKMDSMDLEREKGITIQSAATFCQWKDASINIIDTPGHVDFTIEVERALRVLDGAILVLCGVSGVQSQSVTVDRQMKRYNVPRVAFINKLDRMGANPWKVIDALRGTLKLNAAAVQVPIGLEGEHRGVVDILANQTITFEGEFGDELVVTDGIPSDLEDQAAEKYQEMIECLADADDEIAELYLEQEEIPLETLKAAIRRQTIAQNFVPVFMGSAFKNKGVHTLLDGVLDYLPSPTEVENTALRIGGEEEEAFPVLCNPDAPLLMLAFKLEDGRYGQLTYMRVYQGKIRRGDTVQNMQSRKKIKVPRLVRMHSDEMEEIQEASAGDVVAMFGVDCASMDSFTDGTFAASMTSMFVPEPVMSLAVRPKDSSMFDNFSKAVAKFTREDPTLRSATDASTGETILSGMGELHLEIYIERMNREYGVALEVGNPKVKYREAITGRVEFNHLHKKQTGGSGQFARVIGYVENVEEEEMKRMKQDSSEEDVTLGFDFVNSVIGTNIPPEYIPSCENGAKDAVMHGTLIRAPVQGVRVVLQDGQHHPVDSSDFAFRTSMAHALRDSMKQCNPQVLEPIMDVEVAVPTQFQGDVMAGITRRRGMILNAEPAEDGSSYSIRATVPLAEMFGYSTDLRSSTQGMGEFTMEYAKHEAVPRDKQEELVKAYHEELLEAEATN